MLKLYAKMYGADLAGWSFLTGSPNVIRDLTRSYGVFVSKSANSDVDHSFLTSIVDKNGILRVQYLGIHFDPEEFRRDLLSLMKER
jgi:protein SCO1/2